MRTCLLEPEELYRMMDFVNLSKFYDEQFVKDIMSWRNLKLAVRDRRDIPATVYSELAPKFYMFLRRLFNVEDDYCFCPYKHIEWIDLDDLHDLMTQIPVAMCQKFGWYQFRYKNGSMRANKYFKACRIIPRYLSKREELNKIMEDIA